MSLQPIVGVIPARYGSTRFPGKVLAILGDRTVLHHVHDRAARCSELDRVVVATDDERILREVLAFGGTAVMTSSAHRSGTDRVAEAVESLPGGCPFVINIQGDEPFLDPEIIGRVARALRSDPGAIWTAVCPIKDEATLARPDVVKAAVTADGRVLYFSRAPIPYLRGVGGVSLLHRHHVGIYGLSRDRIRRFVELPPSPLELAEGLEQLRALEAGIPVRAVTVAQGFGGIDTEEDLDQARRHLAAAGIHGGDR